MDSLKKWNEGNIFENDDIKSGVAVRGAKETNGSSNVTKNHVYVYASA